MDRWTKRPLVGWLSIQDWIRKKNKRKKRKRKKGKGSYVWLPVFHSRKAGSRSYERVWGVLTPWLGEGPWILLPRQDLGVGNSALSNRKMTVLSRPRKGFKRGLSWQSIDLAFMKP